MRRSAPLLAVLLLTASAMSGAAPPPPSNAPADAGVLPEWDKLTPTQREALIGPLRDRWNQNVDGRARMFEHAQRWRTMTPEQRDSARRGQRRFDRMDPQQRQRSRALFDKMQSMPPEQRKALREKWKAMTPDERRDWMRQNTPADPSRDRP